MAGRRPSFAWNYQQPVPRYGNFYYPTPFVNRPPISPFIYQQVFPPPSYYQPPPPGPYHPYFYHPMMAPRFPLPPHLREEEYSDEIAARLEGIQLNPPIYPKPKWKIDPASFRGPPRPSKSDERQKKIQSMIAFRCDKNSGISLPKQPYFLGYASPSSNTVVDMENIPDLACSVWYDDHGNESEDVSALSHTSHAFDRNCPHFDQLREKAVGRAMMQIQQRK